MVEKLAKIKMEEAEKLMRVVGLDFTLNRCDALKVAAKPGEKSLRTIPLKAAWGSRCKVDDY